MYSLINQYSAMILNGIFPNHVREYDWLLQNLEKINTPDYQVRYRRYWAMNVAQLSPAFYTVYFDALNGARGQAPQLNFLCTRLYNASARRNGGRILPFSFATKLLHMINPRNPIYDSKVAKFYFFKPPRTVLDVEQRVDLYESFYEFLKCEHARVLNDGLLRHAIREFRQRFQPQTFTDEKIVDSLIWAFVTLLEGGGLSNGQVYYC